MKVKFLTVAAMAAVLLNSCSEDIVTSESAQTPIGFRIAGTRGAFLSTTNLPEKLRVTAHLLPDAGAKTKFFGDIDFKKLDTPTDGIAAGNYLSDARYYWPAGTAKMAFFATNLYTQTATASTWGTDIDNKKITINNFTQAEATADQFDLLGAYCEGTKTDNAAAGVAMTLKHLLAQVEVQAKATNVQYKFEVKGVKIGNVVTKATEGTATWTASNGAPTCVWTCSSDAADKKALENTYATGTQLETNKAQIMALSTASEAEKAAANWIVIPQTLTKWANTTGSKVAISANDGEGGAKNAYLAVKVTITTVAGAPFYDGWAYIPLEGTWEAGKKYTYILDFDKGAGYDQDGNPIFGKPINFKCEVSTWTDGTATNPNMNVN